jgi:phosphopantothenoylcysteine decarboxylase/phosphopantothenoylcysteine decarboxylase/phosphopantothenate--cysteine ligase
VTAPPPTVLLGVTGSIAAHRALDLTSELTKSGVQVDAVLTEGACRFVQPLAFQSLSRRKVYTDLFAPLDDQSHDHIQLAARADLCVVAPCSADVLGKLAAGICDDFLTTVLYPASDKRRLLCPAMNWRMWSNPLTGRNLDGLRKLGFLIEDPDEGDLACGEHGPGRLAPVERIVVRVRSLLGSAGKAAARKRG